MGGAACFSGFRLLKNRAVTYMLRCIPERRYVRHHHREKPAWHILLRDKNDRSFQSGDYMGQSDDHIGDQREDRAYCAA
jgi:hypothetical protein